MNIYFPALPAVHTARSFDNTAKLARDEASMEFYNLFRRTSSTHNHLVNWKNKTIKNLKLYRLISVENGFASLMIAPGRKLLELHFEYVIYHPPFRTSFEYLKKHKLSQVKKFPFFEKPVIHFWILRF